MKTNTSVTEQMNATNMTLKWRGHDHTFLRVLHAGIPANKAHYQCDNMDGLYVEAIMARNQSIRWSAFTRVGDRSNGKVALMLYPMDVNGKGNPQAALDELQRRVDLFLSTAAALP